MKTLTILVIVAFTLACSEPDAVLSDESADHEPPMFVVNQNGTGPLTLAELQIHLPNKIDRLLTDKGRSCFFAEVERLSNEAGDPAKLDPDDLPYWDGKVDQKQWQEHSRYMQRVLLAQAVVSWAMIGC